MDFVPERYDRSTLEEAIAAVPSELVDEGPLMWVEREAQKLLDAQAEQVRGAGGNVARAHLRVGAPDEEIVDLAGELWAGLIVMGSRGQ